MIQRMPIKSKLIVMMVSVTIITMLLAFTGTKLFDIFSLRNQAARQVVTMAKIIADNSTAAILFNEAGDAEQILAGLRNNPSIDAACLYTLNGKALAFYSREKDASTLPRTLPEESTVFTKSTVSVCQDIVFNDKNIGSIYIKSSLREIRSYINQSLAIALVVMLISVIMSFVLAYKIQNVISGPIERLAAAAKQISREKDYSIRITETRNDEIGLLFTAFNEMLGKTQEYSTNLEAKVAERTRKLSQSLEELKMTQTQLIESEKLAALGGLVAGVAHEINTPVGIGITAASSMHADIEHFRKLFENNRVTQADLEHVTKSCIQGNQFILSNLNRAADLIQSFKKVAIDQTSEEKRPFNVKETIENTLLSLQPEIKKTPHTLKITGSDGIEILSYPGLLSQIITNLILNSLIHAFTINEHGVIEINLALEDRHVKMTYSDNGRGIDSQFLSRIFDPFFTTRRGQGSGLGLHIVYNIVNQNLKGSIVCQSEVNSGTSFTILIPVK